MTKMIIKRDKVGRITLRSHAEYGGYSPLVITKCAEGIYFDVAEHATGWYLATKDVPEFSEALKELAGIE